MASSASSASTTTLRHVKFGLLSPDEIRAISCVEVTKPCLLHSNGEPFQHGLTDLRMGSFSNLFGCQTCPLSREECPGHFGHIELVKPVIHPLFFRKVKRLLECLCIYCFRLKLASTNPSRLDSLRTLKNAKRRFDDIWMFSKNRLTCRFCTTETVPPEDEVNDEDEVEVDDGEKNESNVKGTTTTMTTVPKTLKRKKKQRKTKCRKLPTIRKKGIELQLVSRQSTTHVSVKTLEPQHIITIFSGITRDDLELLGFSESHRPEWMILTVLPVPPVPMRPSFSVDMNMAGKSISTTTSTTSASSGNNQQHPQHQRPNQLEVKTNEDDLTDKLIEIVRCNKDLQRHIMDRSPSTLIQLSYYRLQFFVATYMDNVRCTPPMNMNRSQLRVRPLQPLSARLKGKEGRIRYNLMGKRVNFSARTVITGDPYLDLDEVGVPRSMASRLTVPEVVNSFNLQRLQLCVRNGPFGLTHGANYVIRNERRYDLRYNTTFWKGLQVGDIVERHLRNGDDVLFNRQPSLHKMSMMHHRVRIMDYSTFRLNLSVTTPYNADFDGDEMNIHVPQTLEAAVEIQQLANVSQHLISPQASKPIIGLVQDALLAVSLFTRRDVFLTRAECMQILMWLHDRGGDNDNDDDDDDDSPVRSHHFPCLPPPTILKPTLLWTAKQIVSLMLPKTMYMKSTHAMHRDDDNDDGKGTSSHPPFMNPSDTLLLISEGELLYGCLDRKTVGVSNHSLIHVLNNDFSPRIAQRFIEDIQRVVNYWILHHGFSVGIGDCILPNARHVVEECLEIAQVNIQQSVQNEYMIPSNRMEEGMVNRELNTAREVATKRLQIHERPHNNILKMIYAGSKGNILNLGQILVCVGQQNVYGQRIPFHFNARTLPHYSKYNYSPEAKGFVAHSYLDGLKPQEFFFHAVCGRVGLIDTSIKTAESGYLQRRLVKNLEDIMVNYDGTVRKAGGQVVQFIYGGDGMDGAKIEQISHGVHSLYPPSPRLLEDIEEEEWEKEVLSKNAFLDIEMDDLEKTYQQLFQQQQQQQQCGGGGGGNVAVYFSSHLTRLIERFRRKGTATAQSNDPLLLRPYDVQMRMNQFMSELQHLIRPNHFLSPFIQFMIQSLFTPYRVIKEYVFDKATFEHVLGIIKKQFVRALIQPGESVGVVASQSIAEPATQLTLNTFHHTGISAFVGGVSRLNELVNVSKHPKAPIVTLNNSSGDSEVNIATLVHTLLNDLVTDTEIRYEPQLLNERMEDEYEVMEFAVQTTTTTTTYLPWVLRMNLSFEKMIQRVPHVSMDDIALKITTSLDGLQCWCSDDNASQRFLLVRIKNDTILDIPEIVEQTPPPKLSEHAEEELEVDDDDDNDDMDEANEGQYQDLFGDDDDDVDEAEAEEEEEDHETVCGEEEGDDDDDDDGDDDSNDIVRKKKKKQGALTTTKTTKITTTHHVRKKLKKGGSTSSHHQGNVRKTLVNQIEKKRRGRKPKCGTTTTTTTAVTTAATATTIATATATTNNNNNTNSSSSNGNDVQLLIQVEQFLLKMVEVGGIRGIHSVSPNRDHVTGSNNLKVLLPYFPNAISNHPLEVLDVLGIEAARTVLIMELQKVLLEASHVSYRHLSILTDVMTFGGTLVPITRFGFQKSAESGPLGRCTFEKQVDQLVNAALNQEIDNTSSVSSAIMLGKIAKFGTGTFQLFLNESALASATPPPPVPPPPLPCAPCSPPLLEYDDNDDDDDEDGNMSGNQFTSTFLFDANLTGNNTIFSCYQPTIPTY